jgi:hypothetical protein
MWSVVIHALLVIVLFGALVFQSKCATQALLQQHTQPLVAHFPGLNRAIFESNSRQN